MEGGGEGGADTAAADTTATNADGAADDSAASSDAGPASGQLAAASGPANGASGPIIYSSLAKPDPKDPAWAQDPTAAGNLKQVSPVDWSDLGYNPSASKKTLVPIPEVTQPFQVGFLTRQEQARASAIFRPLLSDAAPLAKALKEAGVDDFGPLLVREFSYSVASAVEANRLAEVAAAEKAKREEEAKKKADEELLKQRIEVAVKKAEEEARKKALAEKEVREAARKAKEKVEEEAAKEAAAEEAAAAASATTSTPATSGS